MNKRLNQQQTELLAEMDAFLADMKQGTRAISAIYLTLAQYKVWEQILERVNQRGGHYLHANIGNGQYKGFDVKRIGINRGNKVCTECGGGHNNSIALCDECNAKITNELRGFA